MPTLLWEWYAPNSKAKTPVYGAVGNSVSSKAKMGYGSMSSSTKKPQKVTSSFSRPLKRPP